MTDQLIHVTRGQFTYGLVVRDGRIVDAPPAGRRWLGYEAAWVVTELRADGAQVTVGEPHPFAVLWEQAQAAAAGSTGPLITAQYHGRCRACAGRWEPGDGIAFDEDEGGWICEDCVTS